MSIPVIQHFFPYVWKFGLMRNTQNNIMELPQEKYLHERLVEIGLKK